MQLLENKVVDCLFLEHSMFEHENVDEFIFKLYRFFYIVIIFFLTEKHRNKVDAVFLCNGRKLWNKGRPIIFFLIFTISFFQAS